MAVKLSTWARLSSWIKGGGKRASAISKPDLKNLRIIQKMGNGATAIKDYGKVVANTGAKAGRTLVSWGGALKGAIVAGGGVLAYYLLHGGLLDFLENLFDVDESTAKGILFVLVAVVIVIFVIWILGKIDSREKSKTTTTQYVPYNRGYNNGKRRRKS